MTVHVYTIDLTVDDELHQRLFASLDAEERVRVARFHHARDARRHVVAHGALRDILGRATSRKPGSLVFGTGPQGKPSLVDGPHFNMAHSGDVALVALGPDEPVGVDVEVLKGIPDGVAERNFAPAELAALAAMDPATRLGAFYRLWTCKEALLKADGAGLSLPLDHFEVALDDPARVLAVTDAPDEAAAWQLRALAPPAGYAAALAWRGPPRMVVQRCWLPPVDW